MAGTRWSSPSRSSKSAGHIHYDAATGALVFSAASGGWQQPVQFATLAPHLHLTHADFLFVKDAIA